MDGPAVASLWLARTSSANKIFQFQVDLRQLPLR